MGLTVLTPPEPRTIPAERLARRHALLVAEIESGALGRRRLGRPRLWAGRPRRFRVVVVIVLVLLLGAVGTAIGVGVNLLAQQERFHGGPAGAGGPGRFGPLVEVASGRGWALIAWQSADGLCLDIAVPGNSASGCGFPVRGTGAPGATHAIADLRTPLGPEGAVVAGPAAAGVSRVEVELADGRVVPAALYEAPPELGTDVRFFFAQVPSDGDAPPALAALRAYGPAGKLVERYPLPGGEEEQ